MPILPVAHPQESKGRVEIHDQSRKRETRSRIFDPSAFEVCCGDPLSSLRYIYFRWVVDDFVPGNKFEFSKVG